MRYLLSIAIIMGAGSVALAPAKAISLRLPSLNGPSFIGTQIEKVGYWQRQYRRYGYPAPYTYYPPAYGYYPLLLHTPIRRLCMATSRSHLRMPILHPSPIRHRLPGVETIHPRKAATAIIRPQMETTMHRLTERPAITRRMALSASSNTRREGYGSEMGLDVWVAKNN